MVKYFSNYELKSCYKFRVKWIQWGTENDQIVTKSLFQEYPVMDMAKPRRKYEQPY